MAKPTYEELQARLDHMEALNLSLIEDAKGPEGFASWKDAAIHERNLRVKERGVVDLEPDVTLNSFKYPTDDNRTQWSIGEWARHFGAYETDQHVVVFGSWFAFSNMMRAQWKTFQETTVKTLKPLN